MVLGVDNRKTVNYWKNEGTWLMILYDLTSHTVGVGPTSTVLTVLSPVLATSRGLDHDEDSGTPVVGPHRDVGDEERQLYLQSVQI